jgi:hypothetical protein
LLRGKGLQVGAQTFHARRLPFGNRKSIPFGHLPFGKHTPAS